MATLSAIVKAAGGEVIKYQKGKQKVLESGEEGVYMISGEEDKDLYMPVSEDLPLQLTCAPSSCALPLTAQAKGCAHIVSLTDIQNTSRHF
jgi:hypothetical protein